MGSKNKLKRFKENETFENVFQPTREEVVSGAFVLKGKWNSDFFKNDNPIVLELGCGKGEYSVGLAALYPDKNFIGIDIKGARFWRGAKTAVENGLNNVAFIRTQIELIDNLFAENEVDEIWITFPDPFLREGKANKRLTSSRFLNEYRKIIKPGGILHLKTDDPTLYEFTLETLQQDNQCVIHIADENIYSKPFPIPELAIKTKYEGMNISGSNTIKWIKFSIH